MGVPSAGSFISNSSTGVEYKQMDIEEYYDSIQRQPHCITDPKAYVSGSATHPPPTELTQENILFLCPIRGVRYDSDNESVFSESSVFSDCIDCELDRKEFNSNVTNINNVNVIENEASSDSDASIGAVYERDQSEIQRINNANLLLRDRWNSKIADINVNEEYNAFLAQLEPKAPPKKCKQQQQFQLHKKRPVQSRQL